MAENSSDDGKIVAIAAYFSVIGLIIAFILHSNNKTELGAYHIRQSIGIILLAIVVVLIVTVIHIWILTWIVQAGLLVLWILGLLSAIQGEKKPIPVLGEQFQEWFKGIG
jgi:uncharacterized membrane protein